MSSSGVEKIGLAKESGSAKGLDDEPHDGLNESPDAQRAGVPASAHGVASAPPPPDSTRRPRRVLLVVLLLALAGVALALGGQYQRAEQLQQRAARLEGQVTSLSGELTRAQNEMLDRERQMESVRSAVADLSGQMSALQTLVNEPPGTVQP